MDEPHATVPPEPTIQKYRGPTLVWLLPMVIFLLGGWLVLKAYRSTGPTITITFPSGEGIEPGQTRIKHKDVEIGKVTALGFTPDHSQVVVTAEVKRDAAALLSENAHFWVVRARVSATGISGLGTLLSGAYIGMDPGIVPEGGGKPIRTFQGQEAPSLEAIHEPGALIELRTDKLGYLNLGSPVQYRQVKVGEVVGVNLAPDGRSVSIKVFIKAPYHELVKANSRFWQSGSIDVSVDGGGLRLHSESMLDLLLGSVVLENPVSLEAGGPVAPGQVFTLFPNRDAIFEQASEDRLYFMLHFKESVRGLSRGNSVEFQGIKVGQVEDLKLEFDPQALSGSVPVLIAVDPERLFGRRKGDAKALMRGLVGRGLRAQLQPASLLTGGLFVNLAFHPGKAPAALASRNGFLEIPTLPASNSALVENLTAFVERLQKLPLEEFLSELRASLPALREALTQAKTLMTRLDQETAPQAQATLAQAQTTLALLEQALKADSPVQKDLHQTLDEFAKAAKSLRELMDLLNERPQSLVWGKGKAKAKPKP